MPGKNEALGREGAVLGAEENMALLPGKKDEGEKANSRKIPGQPDYDTYECQTCKNRKYQDGSNDPSVSFKTPTKLSPERAAYAVRAHEAEHVAHAWAQAQREDKEVVSQSVTYHTDICPECGRTYISGGNTQTPVRSAPETYEKEAPKKGANIDIFA